MSVTIKVSRFTVFSGGHEIGVCIPRADSWVFVPNTSPFACYVGTTAEAAVAASGLEVKV